MDLRDPIHGSIEVTKGELAIVDHPLFQRLRSVKQLGFSQLAFPGATHTRLSHGLGTMHLATLAFDSIFGRFEFGRAATRARLRQTVRLAALLHDLGHPPLSHCTEVALPRVAELQIACYCPEERTASRRATHEDITLLMMTQSSLAPLLGQVGHDITPRHVAALISHQVEVADDFFRDGDRDLRPILSQLISGECDVDRMDYLKRDSLYAGVQYGSFDQAWLLRSLTHHVGDDGRIYLALDGRGLYAFDHFLLARYHMFLIVYYHHRSVIFEELLRLYFERAADEYRLPTVADDYTGVDDTQLMARLRSSDNPWARRIVENRPLRLLVERHGPTAALDLARIETRLSAAGLTHIATASKGVLSKYVGRTRSLRSPPIYVVDRAGGPWAASPRPLDQATDLFHRYGEERQIARIYVDPQDQDRATALGVLA